jgi:small subunit ribosomal protein S6
MRRYETIFIVDPDVGDEGRGQLFDRTKSIIDSKQGLLVDFDEWGPRKLAYEIRKKTRGYYVCMDYCGTSDLVNEIERTFRLDDRYLKYMTVMVNAHIDLEGVKAEIAEKEKAAQEEKMKSEAEETVTEKPSADSETTKETPPAAESASQEQPEDKTDRSTETTTPETDKEDE